MAAVFTTWTALKGQMLEDLASGNWRKVSSYSLSTAGSSRSITYRSFSEFREILAWVTDQAAVESGVPAYHGRTYAADGGRGKWGFFPGTGNAASKTR